MKPSELESIGRKLYGPYFYSALAYKLRVHEETIRRWARGEIAVPHGTAMFLRILGKNDGLHEEKWYETK